MNARAVVWAALVCVLAACAIIEGPPGGPEDLQPPGVDSTYPGNGMAGVPPDAVIEFMFDESMTRKRLERLVEFHPPITIRKVGWQGTVLRIETEGLHADTTYVVKLRSGFSDSHGVRNENDFGFAFATSASIDSGMIAGRVFFRRLPTDKGVVHLFVLPKDTTFVPEAARPEREATTDGRGFYVLRHLPTDNRTFLVLAFQDQNGNLNRDGEGEPWALLADTVFLSPEQSKVDGKEISIIDPKEPGQITGVVVNATDWDSIPVMLTLHEVNDSTPPSYVTYAAPEGEYKFGTVLKGTYVLNAFLDLKSDSVCGDFPCPEDSTGGCPEPCVLYPDTLTLAPGQVLGLEEFTLGKGPEGDE